MPIDLDLRGFPDALKTAEAAALLDTSPTSLIRWEAKGLMGEIPRTRGGHRRWPKETIAEFMRSLGWRVLI